MPYFIRKKDNKYCVMKKTGDGKSEQVACHRTRGGAVRQISAINASKKGK